LLEQALAAMDRIKSDPPEVRIETYLTLYCAAGVQKNSAAMQRAWQHLTATVVLPPHGLKQMDDYFLRHALDRASQPFPPAMYPFSLECTYALLNWHYSG